MEIRLILYDGKSDFRQVKTSKNMAKCWRHPALKSHQVKFHGCCCNLLSCLYKRTGRNRGTRKVISAAHH